MTGTFHFRAPGCRDLFAADPLAYLTQAPDPVCGMTVDVAAPAATAQHGGRQYVFCSAGCRDAFTAGPAHYTGQENISLDDPARRACPGHPADQTAMTCRGKHGLTC